MSELPVGIFPFASHNIDLGIWVVVAIGFFGTFLPHITFALVTRNSSLIPVLRCACVVFLLYGAASVYDRYVRDEPQFALSPEEHRAKLTAEFAAGSGEAAPSD